MAAAFGDLPDLQSLERAIYLGEAHTEAMPLRVSPIDLADSALTDAGVGAGSAVGVLVAGSDQAGTIAERWRFPAHFAGTIACGSLVDILTGAWQLLGQAAAVLVVVTARRGGAALVLMPPDNAARRAYADVAAAGAPPNALGYLELPGIDQPPIDPPGCPIGSAGGNLGELGAVREMASLTRAVLAVHHRYIPAARLSLPDERWLTLPRSQPWFAPAGQPRAAWLPQAGGEGGGAVVSEPGGGLERPRPKYAPLRPLRLVSVSADTCEQLLRALEALESRPPTGHGEIPGGRGTYTVALMGRTHEELLREIAPAKRGVQAAFDAHGEWQTPRGSYFTAQPAGRQGGVAFVYPGAFSAYPGMARDVFRVFPRTHAVLAERTADPGGSFAESLIFPRSSRPPDSRELAEYEARLHAQPVAMIECGTACSLVYTHILREALGVTPTASFGYSLGEMSMLWALGAWTDGDDGRKRFRASPLFQTRLAGPKQAVRDYREAIGYTDNPDEVWATYTLLAPADEVEQALRGFDLAFLTVVNSPGEVLIGGDPRQCEAVADVAGCERIRMAFDYPLHCPVTLSEMAGLKALNSYPVHPWGNTLVYSAIDCAPMAMDTDAVAQTVARAVCHRFDFPRLVQSVYDGGARIFIEVGPSAACTRLIDAILGGRPHLAVSMDRRGLDAEASLYRLAARLLSHGVAFDTTGLATPGGAGRQGSSGAIPRF